MLQVFNFSPFFGLQAALQQAGLANPALIPGLLQGMQSLAAGVTAVSTPSSTANDPPLPHIMMQPLQQSVSFCESFVILYIIYTSIV